MTCQQDVNMLELQSNTNYTITFTDDDVARLQSFASAFGYNTLGETITKLLFPQTGQSVNPFDLAKKAMSICSPDVDFMEDSRKNDVVMGKVIVAEYLRYCGLSFERIGNLLHRDHTSIIHYMDIVENAITQPRMYRAFNAKRSAFYAALLQFEKQTKRK